MIGTVLDSRYEIIGLLVDGPVFSAYSARDRTSGRDVLVRVAKSPFGNSPGFYESLKKTTDLYGSVRSQLVESILDVGLDKDVPFYVTDLVRGPTLAERIKKLAPFSIPVSVATAISVCQALEPLHRHRMAHGDLNPQNISVLANGDVRLQLAGIWEVYSASPAAGAMVLPGMAPYLSPEVTNGGLPSPSSDVYALGIILFELLSGRMPYQAETAIATALQHVTIPTPSVREVNPSVPAVLDEIVKKAMAKDPRDRYANASELLADLRLLQDALRFGRPLSWPLRPSDSVLDATAGREKRPAEPQPVAPRMSAVRTDEEYQTSTRRARQERDVPVWMLMCIVFLAAVVLSLIGFWMVDFLRRPQLVAVPNVVGLTSQEARALLHDAKLDVKIAARLPSEKVEMDRVMQTDPPAADKVKEGSRVNLTLSAGSKMVAVPDLRGLTKDKAKSILSSLNLQIDPEVIEQSDPEIEPGMVIGTKPAAKSKTERQSSVKLIVSTGKDNRSPDISTQGGGYLYTIRMKLDDIRDATQLRIEMTDDDGTREIHNELHNPGETVSVQITSQSKKATFNFYYNDELVKQITKEADSQGT